MAVMSCLAAPPMPSTATIVTPRLQLSAVARSDGWELWELWNRPAVREALFGPTALSIDSAMALLDACRASEHGLWLVRSPLTTRLLGCISLCGWPHRALHAAANVEVAEFSVALLPSAQGRGYAFEAASAVIEQTIRAAKVSDVRATVRRGDTRGLSLMSRLGFHAMLPATGNGPCLDFSLNASTFFALLRARMKGAQQRPSEHRHERARADAVALPPWRNVDDFLDTDVMLDT
jgi:RimJ/RimL family protein N-acetyltransferase